MGGDTLMSAVITKGDIDKALAFEMGLPVRTVRKITTGFLWAIAENLSKFGHVWLHNFGQFSASKVSGMPYTRLSDGKRAFADRIQVTFSKGHGLKRTLETEQED
jgi:nucleoid DNA-binding protein